MTTKPRVLCKILADISYVSQALATSVLKYPTFRYHVSKGRSDANLNDPIKLLHLENPLSTCLQWFSAPSLSLTVLAIFMLRNNQLVTVVTRVSLWQISATPLNCPTGKPPLVQTSLTVPELQSFKVSIGRNVNLQTFYNPKPENTHFDA